jgi:hypothetical protein
MLSSMMPSRPDREPVYTNYISTEIMHCYLTCLIRILNKLLNCQILTVVTMVTLFYTFLENDPKNDKLDDQNNCVVG